MKKLLALLLLPSLACAPTTVTVAHTIDSKKWVENEPIPQHPKDEAMPTELGKDEAFITPIEVGMCNPKGKEPPKGPCPEFSGMAVSEARAYRDGLYRIKYEELRKIFDADKATWSAHRELYETQIKLNQENIAKLQPSWWEKNDGTVLCAAGFILGALATVGIVYAVNQADK